MEPSRRSLRTRQTPARYQSDSDHTDDREQGSSSKRKVTKGSKLSKKKKTTTSRPASTTSRGKQRVSKKKEKTRKVGKAKAFVANELEAVQRNAEEREAHINDLVNRLDEGHCRDLIKSIAKAQPGIVLDIMDIVARPGDDEQQPPDEPQPPPQPPPQPQPPARQPAWCRCGNCRIMQTALEDRCCGYDPTDCLSNTTEMQALCLDSHVLNLNMLYRADILAIRNIGQDDARAKNKSFRHAGYRQHTLWQHGRLRRGERRVIPSCCVWKIRDTYPDPSGQYVPFIPGRL